MTALEILRESRKYLGKPGNWTRCNLGYVNGQVCALGAVSRAVAVHEGRSGWARLEYPIDDNNGQRDAVSSLFEAIPKTIRNTWLKQIDEENKKHPQYPLVLDHSLRSSYVYTYNDAKVDGKAKHERTITKWFDRAIKIQEQKDKFAGSDKIISDAIKILEASWCRTQIGGPDYPVCAIGGLVGAMQTWPVISREYAYPTDPGHGIADRAVKPDDDLYVAIKRVFDAIDGARGNLTKRKRETALKIHPVSSMVDAIIAHNDGDFAYGQHRHYATKAQAKAGVIQWFTKALETKEI